MIPGKTAKLFDVSDYLDSHEMVAGYLAETLKDPNPDVFITALGHFAKSHSMTEIAKTTGLGRESLYKSLSSGGNPHFDTVRRIIEALGLRLTVERQT